MHWARAEEFIHAQRLAIAASSQKREARSQHITLNFLLESSIKKACQSISESCGQGIRDLEDKVRATPLVAVSLGCWQVTCFHNTHLGFCRETIAVFYQAAPPDLRGSKVV